MKLKPLNWVVIDPYKLNAVVMGVTLSVYLNNGKWESRLSNGDERPVIVAGFDYRHEAMKHAEEVLLENELSKYFESTL